MTDFQSATRENIRLVQQGLLRTGQLRSKYLDREESIRRRERPYERMLEALYVRDLPLATLADESDLLVHVKGPAASGPTPRVSVLTKVLTSTRDQVTKLAKQIGGVLDLRVPASLDMGFVGLARGSLFVGFSAGQASADGTALVEDNSTILAVEMIGKASQLVAKDASLKEIASEFPDPAERDIAIAAIRQLSPSGQAGVDEVDLYGRHIDRSVHLTTQTRRHARSLMAQPAPTPVVSMRQVQFIGTVRELDLDAFRFEIRNIEGHPDGVRCAHDLDEAEVKRLIDKRVRVRGYAELSAKGAVSLLWVDQIEPLLL